MLNKKITLSYSTVNSLYAFPHTFVNRQLGIKQPDRSYFKAGREAHRVIQDHLAGVKKDERLTKLDSLKFPVVEMQSQDNNTKFLYNLNDKYDVIMYLDGLNWEEGKTLEIKTGNPPMAFSQFVKSPQRKIYNLASDKFIENVLISCTPDFRNIRISAQPATQRDRKEAIEWLEGGIYIIEHLKEYLEKEEPCKGYCIYSSACSFLG